MLGFQIKPESFEVFLRKLEKNKKTPDDFFDKNGYNIEYFERVKAGKIERENNKISAEKDLFLNWLEFISQKEKRLGVE